MPLPTPRKGETKQDFINRFMKNKEAKQQFKDLNQRIAVAYQKWRDRVKKNQIGTSEPLNYNSTPLLTWLLLSNPLVATGAISRDLQERIGLYSPLVFLDENNPNSIIESIFAE